MPINYNELKKEIPYKWRAGAAGTQLAYIDARDVMDVLDEVCGPNRWAKDYKMLGDKMYCGIGIETETGNWVWKWDMGVESNFDPEKGEASDSFKRAAVCWGIGRFLYDIKGDNRKSTPEITKTSVSKADVRDSLGHAYCKECGSVVSPAVEKFSIETYGNVLCFTCQKKYKSLKEENEKTI